MVNFLKVKSSLSIGTQRSIRILKMAAFYSMLSLLLQAFVVQLIFAAGPVAGQDLHNVTLDLKVKDSSLEEVFHLIEKETNFTFGYVKGELPLNKKVTVNAEHASLYSVLEELSLDCHLVFNRVNSHITVSRAAVEEAAPVETGTIKGKVVYASNNEPVVGANIILVGTQMGVATNQSGTFELKNIPAGDYTIQVSYIDCVQKKESIKVFADKTTELNYALEQSLVNLDEVVVTGTMSERKLRSIPTSISVVSTKELENRNLTTLTSALEAIPGFSISGTAETVGNTGSTAYAYLFLRGGAPLSNVTTATGVKILVDGIEIADGSYLETLDPNDIEKIEVSRGPMSSTLYGAGSSSGIIQIFTKKGHMEKLHVGFKTMLTSQESDYTVSNPLDQDYSLSLSGGQGEFGYHFSVRHARAPISRYSLNNGIDSKDWNFNGNMRARVSSVTANLTANYSTSEYGAYDVQDLYQRAIKEGWENPGYVLYSLSDSKSTKDAILVGLDLKHVITDNWYQNLTVGYTKNGYETTAQTDIYGYGYYTTMIRDFKKINARYFTDANFDLTGKLNADVKVGADYVGYEYVDWANLFTSKQEDYTTQYYYSSYGGYRTKYPVNTTGVFGEAVWSYNDKWFLTTGVRTEKNDGYGDDLGWYTMPRVGLAYATEFGQFNVKPRISWGKSSEPANPWYKIGEVGSYYTTLANPNLKPQTQSGYEFGADIYYSNFLTMSFTYYDQKIENLIVRESVDDTTTSAYEYQYQNVAEADNSGLEVSLKAIYKMFSLDLAYSHVSSKYGSDYTSSYNSNIAPGKRILDIPSGSFFVRLNGRIPSFTPWSQKGGNLSVEYRYNGSEITWDRYSYYKDYCNDGTGDYYGYYKEFSGYSKVNLRGNYYAVDNVSVFFDVINLLNNQDWIGYGPLMGRRISFGFKVSY